MIQKADRSHQGLHLLEADSVLRESHQFRQEDHPAPPRQTTRQLNHARIRKLGFEAQLENHGRMPPCDARTVDDGRDGPLRSRVGYLLSHRLSR